MDEASFAADRRFDDAGGDSLQLLKLLFLLEETHGTRLPMTACHVGLTPSELVQIVETALCTETSSTTEPPGTIFLIPGMGGETPLEGGFRAACAPSINIAVADLPDWPDLSEPDVTMDSLIARIAADIAARAPTGPIRLLGFSLGGHVAFGAARQLVAGGREVGFLGILDTDTARRPLPEVRGPAPVRLLRRARWEAHNLLQAARRGGLADRLAQLSARFLTRPGKQQRLRVTKRLGAMPLPSSYVMFLHMYLREELQTRLLQQWQPSSSRHLRIDVPTVLFRSQVHPADEPEDLGWSLLCRWLRVVDVAGGHKSMLQAPHVDDLRGKLITELNRTSRSRLPEFAD